MDCGISAIKWENDGLVILDQTRLPNKVSYLTLKTPEEVFFAIRTMKVRGAPAIGIAAAYGMALFALNAGEDESFAEGFGRCGDYLKSARPTAVNLSWAVDRMKGVLEATGNLPSEEIKAHLIKEACAIHAEDIAINKRIGENLLSLLHDGDTILTHCNAGSLATAGYGTALSPVYLAKERGMSIKVYADETRPRLQGAQLTAFELQSAGVDVTLICDNMAAVVMRQGKIDAVITGCDRVAANGDTANKIGTFNVSILAKEFHIPMYIAAPTPTIDLDCKTGADIPIEERSAEEITCTFGTRTAPEGVKVYNPAFDITPAENITAIVTERGICYPPFSESLRKAKDKR